MDLLNESIINGKWLSTIEKRIKDRDMKEKEPFVDLITKNLFLTSELHFSVSTKTDLETQIAVLKQQLHSVTTRAQSIVDSSISSNQAKDLLQKVKELEDENRNLYKWQAANSQKLVDANEALSKLRNLINGKDEGIFALTQQIKQLEQKRDDFIVLVKEKEGTIQLLQDELGMLQLELQNMEEKVSTLENENRILVERWLRKMNEEAEKMNEANLFYENMVDKLKHVSNSRSIESSQANSLTYSKVRPGLNRSEVPTKLEKTIRPHTEKINHVAVSSEGSLFATASDDRKISVLDLSTGNQKYLLQGLLQSAMCVQFSRGMEYILGTSNDNSIRIWTLDTGRPKLTLTGHIGNVWSAKFTSDAKRVISGSHDRTIKLWDLQKGSCVRSMFTISSVNSLCLTDDSGVISGHLDNSVRLWDTKTGDCVKEVSGIHAGQITSVNVSPDAYQILTCSRDNTLKLIDLRTFAVLSTFHAENLSIAYNHVNACFSPDGVYVAAGSSNGAVFIFNALNNMETVTELKYHHKGAVTCVAWNPLGKGLMYSCDKDGNLGMWT